MDVKGKIFKRKSGKSKDKWVIRIEYFDDLEGKIRFMERHTDRKSDATDEMNRLIDDVKKSHGQMQTGERMTFEQLVKICEKAFYKPAEIVQGKKIVGVRSIVSVKAYLNHLEAFFGKRLIREITTESLTSYKLWRLKPKTKDENEKTVKIATVNRELSTMRKMMRFAYGKGWILRDIFFNAKVIDVSAEVERNRLLTKAEEIALLNSCHGEREVTYTRKWKGKEQEVTATIKVDNPHLKAIITLALDSGMRLGEILKLRWNDIDFDNELIRILGTHTKTERGRIAPLSERVITELESIRKLSPGEQVFPYTEIKRSFNTAKTLAKIENLRFHDLRRTAITRWIQQGVPITLAGKLAGHSQLQTTMKHYTATDAEMLREITAKINNMHSHKNAETMSDKDK